MEWLALLPWLLMMAVLTGVGAPIAASLFGALPRKGAAFALPTALIPVAILVFWIGQITFGPHTVVLAVLLVGGLALLATRRGASPDWRAVAAMYGVFLVGFAIMVLFRSANPSITPAGGEQFLHFGLVNALERAPSLPPEDFWYAGEPLKYYYGTQMQVTSFSMLSGTPIRYGFNLGIATFYGVLVVVAYGLVGGIVAARGYSRRFGGAMGALFVAIAGPATTPIRLLTPYLPDGIRRAGVAPAAPPPRVTSGESSPGAAYDSDDSPERRGAGEPESGVDREWLPAPIRDRIRAADVHGRRFRRVADREAPLEA